MSVNNDFNKWLKDNPDLCPNPSIENTLLARIAWSEAANRYIKAAYSQGYKAKELEIHLALGLIKEESNK